MISSVTVWGLISINKPTSDLVLLFHTVFYLLAIQEVKPYQFSSTLRFEKETLFLQFGLPSTLIHSRKQQGNLKTPAIHFRVGGKNFENRAFGKQSRHDFLDRGFVKNKLIQNIRSHCSVFKFRRRKNNKK